MKVKLVTLWIIGFSGCAWELVKSFLIVRTALTSELFLSPATIMLEAKTHSFVHRSRRQDYEHFEGLALNLKFLTTRSFLLGRDGQQLAV